jgi:AraC-like DNA-binding protein
MNGFQSSLYLAAVTLCVFSAGVLRAGGRVRGRSLDYFSVFLAVQAVGFVLELLMSHPATPFKSLWLGLRLGSALLVAPALYLAIKEVVDGERPVLSSLGSAQFWLIGLGFLVTLPLIESAHAGSTYYNPAVVPSWLHKKVVHTGMLVCIGIFAWQVPFYLLRCRRMLQQQWQSRIPADSGAPSRWLQWPLVIVATTWVLGMLRTAQCATHAPAGFGLLFAVTEVTVTVGAIYAIVRRAALTAAQPIPEMAEVTLPPEPEALPEPETEVVALPVTAAVVTEPSVETAVESKYAKSRLDPHVRERIQRKLMAALTKDAVYTDSLISLRSLSSTLKENAHAVSQVINQDLGLSFYELVNQHRIRRAKEMLIEFPDQTVLEIALAVGFNSKSTFNTAFRRNTGQTPTEYRGVASAQQAGADTTGCAAAG